MEAINLEKGQTISLKKEDGSSISKILVGLAWDLSPEGGQKDLDLFIVRKEDKKVAYFNAKTAIEGIVLGSDNLTGVGDGDDETATFDATKTSDGTYIVCVNIFQAKERGQKFSQVNNAKVTVYNTETNAVLATYSITENGGEHTALVVAEIKDSGDNYTFTAKGDFIDGDITQVVASL